MGYTKSTFTDDPPLDVAVTVEQKHSLMHMHVYMYHCGAKTFVNAHACIHVCM